MKVIKEGRPQKGWAKEYECTGKGNSGGGCGAILLVEQDDIFKTVGNCYGNPTPDVYATFQCCQCSVLTDIPNGQIPSILVSVLLGYSDWKKSKTESEN